MKSVSLHLRRTLWILGGIAIVAVVALLAYSTIQYQSEGIEQTGIIVCNTEECLKAVHIHADIKLNMCGTFITLPREDGHLDSEHTHKEKNYLHFHERISLDPVTKEELPEPRLRVGRVMEDYSLEPKLLQYCPPNPKVEVLINGEIAPEGMQTQWKNGDDILLRFYDSTSPDENSWKQT